MENKAAQMDKVYNPQAIEGELYKEWEETGAFVAHREEGKKPFTIVMPPPNITGQLHMGHAMDGVLQDSLTRYHRMKGDPTLWLPGTDHASIATEVKIVEAMRKEGLDKHDVGREEFLRARVGMEERVRRTHCSSDPPHGQQLRLEPRTLHDGRGMQQGRHGGFQQPV